MDAVAEDAPIAARVGTQRVIVDSVVQIRRTQFFPALGRRKRTVVEPASVGVKTGR
jgi:hypothetical protein